MCGRFTLTTSPREIARSFGLAAEPELAPRFNIAPGQEVANVQLDREGRRALVLRRWGLVPHWARDPRIGSRLINARCETVAVKPAYRDALRERRCLVPADGFYEWADAAGGGPRQPYHVARRDRGCFAIAGLFERWREPEGSWLETCTLLTTDANPELAAIHDRMPLVLPPDRWTRWLDPRLRDPAALEDLLREKPAVELEAVAVSRRVNRPEHDDAACVTPLAQGAGP